MDTTCVSTSHHESWYTLNKKIYEVKILRLLWSMNYLQTQSLRGYKTFTLKQKCYWSTLFIDGEGTWIPNIGKCDMEL